MQAPALTPIDLEAAQTERSIVQTQAFVRLALARELVEGGHSLRVERADDETLVLGADGVNFAGDERPELSLQAREDGSALLMFYPYDADGAPRLAVGVNHLRVVVLNDGAPRRSTVDVTVRDFTRLGQIGASFANGGARARGFQGWFHKTSRPVVRDAATGRALTTGVFTPMQR